MRKISVTFFFILVFHAVHAQGMLTLQDALQIAVANNYAVIIARNDQEANKYARNIGNAGMLPTIGITGSAMYTNGSVRQETSAGGVTNKDGAISTNYAASAQLSWTLFDGLRMFATYDRLTQIKHQSEVQTRLQIETLMVQVMQSYFDVVKNKQILASIDSNIVISQERVQIAEKKFSVGTGAQAEVLQSNIDLNNLKTQRLNQEALILQSKTNLNNLLARETTTSFEVEDSIPIGNMLELNDVRTQAADNNSQVIISKFDIGINKYARREINALRFPWLTFNTSYNFSRQQNQAGFILLNQNLGFNAGISLSFNIFDSWRVNTQYKLATFALDNARLRYDQTRLQTDAAVVNAYNNYISFNEQLKLQKQNADLATQNINLSLERFKQGLINYIDLRQIQLSYLEVMSLYITAQYNVKVQEIELLRLKGELIK